MGTTPALVIGNPRAGRGRVVRHWDGLLARLVAAGFEPAGRLTERPGHAVELAAEAATRGWPLVVAAGGDGTVHEVVNGLLTHGSASPPDTVPALGLVPAGSGCDYARTFGVPPGVDGAVAHLAGAGPRPVDVGEVHCEGAAGPHVRRFVNIAEVGIGADVAERAARLPRALGPGRYALALALTLPGQRPVAAEVEIDGDVVPGPLANLVVALGRYFGGGMHIAPGADPSRGHFEVQVQSGSKLDYARALPRVFRGTHLPHPRVHEARARSVTVTCDPPARLEADGEVLGTTPARFTLLPRALAVRA
ncbi:MAG TPA: diacylglycerol kinase family protein [Acidimicrobiales bacterium]|nr:diacylglycerol kinase family protein [Acidimicrobiales bacterium]